MTTDATAPVSPRLAHLVATGSIVTLAFMGSVIVTPLYPVYQQAFGFSEVTLTLVYATYTIGNIAALLSFGQISDQIGRRRAALPGLGLAALSALAFLVANGTVWLYLGRLLIGLAVGILSGTGTAWMAEHLGPERRPVATVASASANLVGIALGPLVGGLLAEYAPAPRVLPFVVYLVLLLLATVGVLSTPDLRGPTVDRLREVRVHARLGVPRELLGRFAAPGVAGFVTFALGGLYFALIPGIVIRDLHVHNLAVGGAIVSELAVIAVAGIVLGRRIPPRTAMLGGLLSLLLSVGLIVAAQAAESMPLLVVATAFAGVTMAFGYRGSLEIVNDIAPADSRAELVSTYFICCFVGNSVPVIGVGLLTGPIGPLAATAAFAVTIAVFSLGAIAWYLRDQGRDQRRVSPASR